MHEAGIGIGIGLFALSPVPLYFGVPAAIAGHSTGRGEHSGDMIHLIETLGAWHSSEREAVLKGELERLAAARLPLQQALARGSHVTAEPFRVMVLATDEEDDGLRARVGVFFTGIISGCQCADDPTPLEGFPEYAEIEVTIQRETGAAKMRLLD